MRNRTTTCTATDIHRRAASLSRAGLLLLTVCFCFSAFAKKHEADETAKFLVRVEAPSADLLQAVKEVTQDQIIHGTYSYEKERILYGAHSAGAASIFGAWQGQGVAFYKVANNVLSPRYFKDTEDIGTISVRYVVQESDATSSTLRIDAVFVDARNAHHPSLGNVESSEFAAIQEHLRKMEARRVEAEQASTRTSFAAPSPAPPLQSESRAAAPSSPPAQPVSVVEMQKRVDAVRHEVELRVKDQGAQLKAAPFHSAASLETLPAQTDVVVVILTPYWYGVETEKGHHGWVHHSQLEPLP